MTDRIDASASQLSAEAAARLDGLFRAYHSRLLAFAATQTRDYAAAEDVVSEAWLRAAASLHQLRADDSRAYGWLRAIVVRASVDHYRPRHAEERPADWTDAVTARALPVSPPADDALYVLADLKVCEARAFKLAAQGLGPTAIGARLGWHHSVVSRRLKSGAKRLRSPLAMAG